MGVELRGDFGEVVMVAIALDRSFYKHDICLLGVQSDFFLVFSCVFFYWMNCFFSACATGNLSQVKYDRLKV